MLLSIALVVDVLAGGAREPAAAIAPNKCATPAKDGSISTSGTPNTYYAGSGTAAANATSLTLGTINASGSAVAFTPGDLALVIQMQGATINKTNTSSYGLVSGQTAGTYEYVSVVAVAGSTLTIAGTSATGGLNNTYTSTAATGTLGQQTWQVVRVPQYGNFTVNGLLTTAAWNGSSGGIIALDVAGTLTLTSSINADGYGFRGGGQNTWGNGWITAISGTKPANAAATGADNQTNTDYVYAPTYANMTYTDTTGADEPTKAQSGGPDGFKGEGIAGTPTVTYTSGASTTVLNGTLAADGTTNGYPGGSKARGAPANAGGGATDASATGWAESPNANSWNSGAGGGANGGAGGTGGENWDGNSGDNGASGVTTSQGIGGAAIAPAIGKLLMGGGGGAGSNNDGTYGTTAVVGGGGISTTPTATSASSGGSGGGIVMLRVGTVASGTITAKGISAPEPDIDGGGGGGAGGTVVLSGTGTVAATINVSGGAGANSTHTNALNSGNSLDPTLRHGDGGGGGGGLVFSTGSPTVTAAGGAAGSTTTSSVAYGATAGGAGPATQSITLASIPGIKSGAQCAALYLAKRITTYTVNGGSAVTYGTYTATGWVDPGTGLPVEIADWPQVSSAPKILGVISRQANPLDTLEYTIYTLSAGGVATTTVGLCDYIPPDSTIVAAGYGAGQAIKIVTGSATPATAYLPATAVTTSGNNGFYPINTATGVATVALPAACAATVPKDAATGLYSSGAIYRAIATQPPFFSNDTGYVTVSFVVKVN